MTSPCIASHNLPTGMSIYERCEGSSLLRSFFCPSDPEEIAGVCFARSRRLSEVALKVLKEAEFLKEKQNLEQVDGLDHCLSLRFASSHPTKRDHFVIETEKFGDLDLYDYRAESLIPIEFVQVIAKQLVEAIDKIHKIGAVYIDFKPENVAIKFPFQAEVLDFGSMTKKDIMSESLGTIKYAPLEVLFALPVNYRSDLWSLGLTLFFAYTGQNIASFFENIFENREKNNDEIELVIDEYIEQLKKQNLDTTKAECIVQIFICLNEFQRAFGILIPSDIIKLACEYNSNTAFDSVKDIMCAFMFDSEGDTFRLKSLAFEFPETLPWDDVVRRRAEVLKELGFEEKDEDIDAFIDLIRRLCSYEQLTTEELLKDGFLSNNFAFKIKVRKELLKKNYQLEISSSDGEKKLILIDLNRSQKSIEKQCFHLIEKYGPEYQVKITDSDDQIIEDRGTIQIIEGSTLAI